MSANEPLTVAERAAYEWQLGVPDFGEEGQRKLKGASVLVSRLGGLGGVVAYELAAAGVGRLVLAHGGDVVPSDLNRQLLMTHEWIGRPRIECATVRLRELNPRLKVEAIGENVHEENVARLVGEADLVVDCAPLFDERFLMNRECVLQNKPMIDCAMYNLDGHVLPIVPGKTPCLACMFPESPPHWKRRFPVFGAVSALVANVGVMEGLKLTAGFGTSNLGKMMLIDADHSSIRKIEVKRRADCSICA